MEVYVARQPIFKKDKRLFGYELLFRGGMSNYFPDIDGDTATSKLLSNTFITIGVEKITGKRKAFINFTEDLLIQQVPLMFPQERLVVEILEDVEPTEEVIAVSEEIAKRGYHIALDDFLYRSELRPLIRLADIIKLDLRASSFEEMAGYMKEMSDFNIHYLAEKVETYEEFQKALEMGFDYFQGYFFSKPEIIKEKDISGTQLNLLQIMAEVNKRDFRFEKVERIMKRDVAIPYKLLRYINSAYFGISSDISSIKQAISLLGENGIRRFLSLMAMATLGKEKPPELVRVSTVRARFCELVGNSAAPEVDASELFTLGLFSLIDALVDDSMAHLMESLPLSGSIKGALVEGSGALRDYLELVACYETGDWQRVSELAGTLGLDEAKLPGHHMEALAWADSLTGF
ncbi:MAG: HDOD domain-containing protein [Thermodesulfobacteriota bacterium]|nr:HDOD domain-containing protein [Thermodesulfobacteriota bacterium]